MRRRFALATQVPDLPLVVGADNELILVRVPPSQSRTLHAYV